MSEFEQFRIIETNGIQRIAHICRDPETGEISIRHLLWCDTYEKPEDLIARIRTALDKPVIIWPEEDPCKKS